jgi:hypothetical protein
MMPGAKIRNPKKGWVEVQSIESTATIQRHSYNLAGTATSRESAWKLDPQINPIPTGQTMNVHHFSRTTSRLRIQIAVFRAGTCRTLLPISQTSVLACRCQCVCRCQTLSSILSITRLYSVSRHRSIQHRSAPNGIIICLFITRLKCLSRSRRFLAMLSSGRAWCFAS